MDSDIRSVTLEEQRSTPILEEHETICWGCGLRLLLSSYAPTFKCGWCGAITRLDETPRKADTVCFSHWRCFRDRFFITLLVFFMIFVICVGSWAVHPVVFSMNFIWRATHCVLISTLSGITITTFCLASFRSPGAPPNILWGSYPAIGKNDLENYTFCEYCKKPKPPRAHHCRSCKMCVMDMDHHCPFIGNCVGASNHQAFVFFLISVVVSCGYVAALASYASFCLWPRLDIRNILMDPFYTANRVKILEGIFAAFSSSVLLFSTRNLILFYLAFASVSVEIGISVLLWQQLSFVYEGSTYINSISSHHSSYGERGFQNVLQFFSCPRPVSKLLLCSSSAGRIHDDHSSKIL